MFGSLVRIICAQEQASFSFRRYNTVIFVQNVTTWHEHFKNLLFVSENQTFPTVGAVVYYNCQLQRPGIKVHHSS